MFVIFLIEWSNCMNKIIKTLIFVSFFVQLNGAVQRIPKFDESGSLVRESIIHQFTSPHIGDDDLMSNSELQAFAEQQQRKNDHGREQSEFLLNQSLDQSERSSDLSQNKVASENESNNRERVGLFSEYQQYFMKILAFFP